MDASIIFIAISILTLVLIIIMGIILMSCKKERKKSLSPLTILAFGFIITGMFVGGGRFIGYGFMGVGVAFAVFDMFLTLRRNKVQV